MIEKKGGGTLLPRRRILFPEKEKKSPEGKEKEGESLFKRRGPFKSPSVLEEGNLLSEGGGKENFLTKKAQTLAVGTRRGTEQASFRGERKKRGGEIFSREGGAMLSWEGRMRTS